MATLLFGGAEGVLAQDPMTGVIGSLGLSMDAFNVGGARTLNTTPCTVGLPRAPARVGQILRDTHCGGCAFLV